MKKSDCKKTMDCSCEDKDCYDRCMMTDCIKQENEDLINKLIKNELLLAGMQHPDKFVSMHDGNSVIREEIQEAKYEFRRMKWTFKDHWNNTCLDNLGECMQASKTMKSEAILAIQELIQVAAMNEKYIQTFKNEVKK